MSMETKQSKLIMDNWKRQDGDLLWWHKVPDPVYGESTGTRAVDVVACYKERFVGIEFKLRNNEQGFRIEKIRQSQVEALTAIDKAGGIALLLLITRLSSTTKYAHVIPISAWRRAIGYPEFHYKKSFQPDDWFADFRFTQQRSGPYVNWDFTKLRSMFGN